MKRKYRSFGGKTFKRLRVFGPFLMTVALIVLVAGGFLQWRLYRLAQQPRSIAQIGAEKHLVNSIQEGAVALLNAEDAVSFGQRLRDIKIHMSSWTKIHQSLARAVSREAVPEEIRGPLVERVFPLYDDIVRSWRNVTAALAVRQGQITIEELRPLVREVQNKTELYLFYLDHLDLKLAEHSHDQIVSLRWIEGVLVVLLGCLLLVTTFWLFMPASRTIRVLVRRMNQILHHLHEKNRSLRRLKSLVQERLQVALDVSKTGTFVWSEKTGRLEWDRNLADLFGVGDPGEIKTVEDFMAHVMEEDRYKVRRHIAKTRECGQDTQDMRVEVKGETRWLRDHCQVIRHGDEVKVVGACTDITPLMREVEAFKHAREMAEKANRSKTEFIATMSHDMRNPLATILGFADLLLREKEIDEARQRQLLELMVKNGRSLLRFVEDLLDVTRIETGHESVSPRPFALQKLLAEISESFQVRCKSKSLQLEVLYHDVIPPCLISDSTLIERVVSNLISNAIRYSDRGKITVDVYLANFEEKPASAGLSIFVSDQGRGIPPEKQTEIFAAFSQRQEVKDTNRSIGLGLYVGRKLAGVLGGELVLEKSAVGIGSTFRFTVPVQKAAAAERTSAKLVKPALRIVPEAEYHGLEVLVVEDDPNLQELMRAILARLGAASQIVGKAESALEILQQHVFDLVTMDIRLPGMDGVEATRRLRKNGYPGYIVAVSAHAFADERHRAIAAGCDEYLTKPIDLQKLTEVFQRALQRKKEKEASEAS